MPVIYKDVEVEVDVDLDDFLDDDLVEELKKRNANNCALDNYTTTAVREIYEKRRCGKDYQQELNELIYQAIGRIA